MLDMFDMLHLFWPWTNFQRDQFPPWLNFFSRIRSHASINCLVERIALAMKTYNKYKIYICACENGSFYYFFFSGLASVEYD